ncbi:putative 37S ribosomal protein S24, mitochondrial [Phyllosticta capitalensis]
MASASKNVSFYARSWVGTCQSRTVAQCARDGVAPPRPQLQRGFSSTPMRSAKEKAKPQVKRTDPARDAEEAQYEEFKQMFGELPSRRTMAQETLKGIRLPESLANRKKREQKGFWNEGEPSAGEDDKWEGDDIPTFGHAELDQQREIRDYMRKAAWEMPLLAKYAKPFQPPTEQTPLRFRYTTYMGESHPAQNKVTVQFSVHDLPNLTQVQKDKLIKLSGPRYNPETGTVKMSAENFQTQAQNKRYLGQLIKNLLDEARNPKDTFADLPFDFRHHKPKPWHQFPAEWAMSADRRKALDAKWQERLQIDQERIDNNRLIDGASIIEKNLNPDLLFGQSEEAAIHVQQQKTSKRPQTMGIMQ